MGGVFLVDVFVFFSDVAELYWRDVGFLGFVAGGDSVAVRGGEGDGFAVGRVVLGGGSCRRVGECFCRPVVGVGVYGVDVGVRGARPFAFVAGFCSGCAVSRAARPCLRVWTCGFGVSRRVGCVCRVRVA